MERHYNCPGCGRLVIVQDKQVLHEAPECALFAKKIKEITGHHTPNFVMVRAEVPSNRKGGG